LKKSLSHVPVPIPKIGRIVIKIINKPNKIAPPSNEKREIILKNFGSSFVFKYKKNPPIKRKNTPIPKPTKVHIKMPSIHKRKNVYIS
jgi:hypothetical protein